MMWIANSKSLDERVSVPCSLYTRMLGLSFMSCSQRQSQASLLSLAGLGLLSSERLFFPLFHVQSVLHTESVASWKGASISFWGPADAWRAGPLMWMAEFALGLPWCVPSEGSSADLAYLTHGRAVRRRKLVCVLPWMVRTGSLCLHCSLRVRITKCV